MRHFCIKKKRWNWIDGRVDNRKGWRFYFLGRIINSFFHVRKVGGDAKQETAYWSFQSWNVAINCRLYFVNFRSLKLFSFTLTPSFPSAPDITFATVTKLLGNLSAIHKTSFQRTNWTNFKNHTCLVRVFAFFLLCVSWFPQ